MINSKLWSGRFAKATHQTVDAYNASITFDWELYYEDILGSLAHADMLQHCGIITPDESQQLQAGLKQIAKDITAGKIDFQTSDEDIHMNIERILTENLGPIAGKLHTARSRNDQVALDLRLYLRKQILSLLNALISLQAIIISQAEKYAGILMPGYTHLQRAQPIYLAQYWLAYAAMLQRDIERMQDCWQRVNQSPLGACALAGTTFPIDRYYLAQLLGFDGICINTLDAVSDRDFIVEFLSASSIIMMHISRMSEELILWSSQEFNFISFADEYATGSSIMPQKKNPDVAELGRGKTGRVYGALFNILTVLKGLPLAYNKDMQEDKEPLFDTVKTLQQTLEIYQSLLSTLEIHPVNMKSATENGYLNATALAEYLVQNGLPFRQAHEVVGKMVAHCIQKNCQLADLSLVEMQNFSPVITQTVYQMIDAEQAANRCNSTQQDSWLNIQFKAYQEKQILQRAWFAEKKAQIENVYNKFDLLLENKS